VSRVLGDETVLTQGIEAGEQVVVDGAYRLTKGSKVNLQKPKSGRSGSTS